MPKKVNTDAPAQVTNAKERGQMLRHLISRTHKSAPAFAAEVDLPRSTLSALLQGDNDVEDVIPATAEKILNGLGMPDKEVADKLGLSEAARRIWKTQRPSPTGHGPAISTELLEKVRLTSPLMGEVVLPSQVVVTVDRGNTQHGVQIVRLASGELFSMKAGPSAVAAGQLIGRLLCSDFSAVL